MGPYLPGEDLLDAVVVADGGERGHVAGQRERGKRAPLVLVTADEFRGEVLRLRCFPKGARGLLETEALRVYRLPEEGHVACLFATGRRLKA